MTCTLIREHYQLTLPLEVRKKIPVNIGDPVEIRINKNNEIVIKPLKLIDASQSWFWAKEHQKAEREAEKELSEGKGRKVKNAKELINELQK